MSRSSIMVLQQVGRVGAKNISLIVSVLVSGILSAQVVNESWRPDEGPVCYAVPILDYAAMKPQELAIHYFTNLARMGYDCGTPSLKCVASETLPLLSFDFRLATAARWFSKHLNDIPCFQHDTCCMLTLTGDAVECIPGTACTNQPCDKTYCVGTSWVERIALFGGNPTGENLAAGYDTAVATICQWMNSPGHRDNICLSTHTSLGTGYYGGQNCFYHYWTQDFGVGSQTSRLYPGALFEDSGLLKAGIIVKSPSPVTAAAVTVGNSETALANTFGTNLRGAWTATVSAANCAAYFFTASFDDGKSERFPPNGYLFYSDMPDQCSAPDEIPDADTDSAFPDTESHDSPQTDEASDTDETTGDADEPFDVSPDEDHTIPYDFNPADEDYQMPDYMPSDAAFIWPDEEEKTTASSSGCGCSVMF